MKRRVAETEPLARLNTPLVRRGEILEPVTWDEALEVVVHGFTSIRAEKGPEAIGLFSCSKSTNEMNYAAQKFMRTAIGSNNIDSCNRT